jgi:hypothetical protein
MLQGLAEITQGGQPTKGDWSLCCDAINMTEALMELGVVEDTQGLIEDAVAALSRSAERYLAGGQIRLDGPGLSAMRAVIEDYIELVGSLPARTIIRAHRRAERRLAEIRRGKRRDTDISIGRTHG